MYKVVNMKKSAILPILIFVIIIVLIFNVWSVEKQNIAPLAKNDQWIKNTLQNITDSQDTDGGYSLLISERMPSLYHTRYNVEIFQEYQYEIPRKAELVNTLRLMEEQPVKTNGFIEILNLSHIVHLLRELNIAPSQEFLNSVIKGVSSFEGSDGLFRVPENDNLLGTIALTEISVGILNDLGVKHDYQALGHTIFELNEGKDYKGSTLWNASKSYPWSVLRSVYNIEKLTALNSYYLTAHGKTLESRMNKESELVFSHKSTDVGKFINDSQLFQLITDLGFQPIVTTEYTKFLNSIRSPNGGVGLDSKVSDPQLTLASFRIDSKSFENAKKYMTAIKTYQLPGGMFTSNNQVNSNVISSFDALSEYESLGSSIPNSLKQYFLNVSIKGLSPKEVYYWLKGVELLNLKVSDEMKVTYNKKIDKISEENDLYTALIDLLVNGKTDGDTVQKLRQLENVDGGYGLGGISSLQQTSLIVRALDSVGASYPKESLTHWLNSKQLSDGSFSLKRVSDMTETYYALTIFDTIKALPNNLKGLSGFLETHKSVNGGYVYLPGSTSTISVDSLYFGIESEVLLKKWVKG
jgi:hypothetical protein